MTGGAMSSSPVAGSTKAVSPKVGGAANSPSKAPPGECDAMAEGSPNTGGPALLPTPDTGAATTGDAEGAVDEVGRTRSSPAIAR